MIINAEKGEPATIGECEPMTIHACLTARVRASRYGTGKRAICAGYVKGRKKPIGLVYDVIICTDGICEERGVIIPLRELNYILGRLQPNASR